MESLQWHKIYKPGEDEIQGTPLTVLSIFVYNSYNYMVKLPVPR